MTSFKIPTQRQIELAVQRMKSPEFSVYFLSRLENPNWVKPLEEKGLFASPPPAIREDDGSVSFPRWPASRYLARMAKHVPSDVASILANLNTENASVIGDTIDAALAMPANVAAGLVPGISRSAEGWGLWLNFKEASDLCVYLAQGRESSAAMRLADALFTPKFEEGGEELARREEYWYKDGLAKVAPVLVREEPREFLRRLCEWLKLAVDAKKHVDPDSGRDYSYMWRPAIEEHGQNLEWDFAGSMVGFVRQGFEEAIRSDDISHGEGLELLCSYPYLIFRRIKLHLIGEFAEKNPELAKQVMMDRDLFEDYHYKHEYAVLVGRRLDLLAPEEREQWFGWVDAGPDMSDFDNHVREVEGRDATDEDRQNRKDYWRFEKLHCVREHLDDKKLSFYRKMLAQHGEPGLADFNTRIRTGWVGHQSPMTVDDLTALTFEAAVDRVSSWKPLKRPFMGPNIEGLSETFEQYVGSNPEVFSQQAHALIRRPAIFVRGFLKQCSEAIKAGQDIDVPTVLDLCRWVMERPIEERAAPEGEDDAVIDRDWQWTRDEISGLVQNICEARVDGAPKFPLSLRESLWSIVSPLTRDSAKSYIVHEISENDPRTRDYLDLSINSPRGKAVEAALEYARWVGNHLKRANGDEDIVPGGLDAIPEVREMLEWQIERDNRSFEALAMIGSRIGLLYWIDKEWLDENAARLFHLEGIEETNPMSNGWAAWNAFLVWVKPHVEFYRLFREQFAYAVAHSSRVRPGSQGRGEPMNHLGEHLMLLYGRGQLGFDEDEGLLRNFLAESHPDIRRHSIGFVGRSLEAEEEIPQEIVNRFRELWEVYWAGRGKQDTEEEPDAWLFGIWFASGKFAAEWAIEALEEFVGVTPTPEPDHAVMEQLARVAAVDPVRAIQILDRMVRADRPGWRLHGWLDSAREILEVVMRAGGEAQRQAETTIDYLGRRGHTAFGALLHVSE